MEPVEYNAWARPILWAQNLPAGCPVHQLEAGSEACANWVRAFQARCGLAEDGCLGPSTLLACMAVFGDGACGGAMIGGAEVDLGVPVVRMLTVGRGPLLGQPPRLAVLLAAHELPRLVRQRLRKERPLRAHFTIDASRGRDGHSLIVQWADPAELVPFCPSDEDGDYPAGQAAVGIELDNPVLVQRRDTDRRLWRRERSEARATMCGQVRRHMAFHVEQIAALERLQAALEAHLGVPRVFPVHDGKFDTRTRPGAWAGTEGYLARFNFVDAIGEPGAGLIEALPRLFPEALGASEAGTHEPTTEDEALVVEDAAGRSAPLPVSTPPSEAEQAALASAWSVGSPTPLVPSRLGEETFSLSRALRRRRGRGGGPSRAEALRQRLLGQAGEPAENASDEEGAGGDG